SGNPSTMEGKIVRLSDKIAYINHDIDDAIRAGLLTEEMLPPEYTAILGHSVRERLNTLIHSIIENSYDKPDIIMDPDVEMAMSGLRRYMFANVYKGSVPKQEDDRAKDVLKRLYFYYLDHTEELAEEYLNMVWIDREPWSRVVCDYVAGMTDGYAIECYKKLFVPKAWQG
ncbi:MAG: deoxyguanosinetriphosphate triphosphohydrolase, partial [Clostridia bacterium]|nr:deoxyguanosinetriphosphate triphosphohydrolase [Clostridia bacterium]